MRVGLLVACLLAITPGVANAFTKAIWGPAFVNGANQFPIYKQLHVGIVEQAINWAEVAPTRPQQATDPSDPAYLWPDDVQQAIDQARIFHMRILIQLVGAPPWANGHNAWRWMPHHPKDFANFAKAAAREYPSVHLWMIWGEPSRKPNFAPFYSAPLASRTLNKKQQIAPRNYARLLDASYGALKSVSRKNLVIGGDTYTTGDISAWAWIKYMRLPNGHRPRMDMYGHNPFSFIEPSLTQPTEKTGASQFVDLPGLAAWIDKYLKKGLPLFLSEFTVPTAPDQEFNYWVSMPTAVKWVRDALRLSRSWHRIYSLGWIHVYDAPPYSSGGLLTQSGKRKPTFNAFAH